MEENKTRLVFVYRFDLSISEGRTDAIDFLNKKGWTLHRARQQVFLLLQFTGLEVDISKDGTEFHVFGKYREGNLNWKVLNI